MNVATAYPILPTSSPGVTNASQPTDFANAAAVAGPPIAAEEATRSLCGATAILQNVLFNISSASFLTVDAACMISFLLPHKTIPCVPYNIIRNDATDGKDFRIESFSLQPGAPAVAKNR